MVTVIRDKILNHLVRFPPSTFARTFHHSDILNKGADWVPLVIVGNKSDLNTDQRQVQVDEGRQLAQQFNCGFTEASARLDSNVARAFDLMIGEIEKSQNPSQPTGDSKCVVM